jgi:hypothetical protein
VIKERLQIQKSSSPSGALPNYKGSLDAFQKTFTQEGLRGIYRGYGATLLSFGPFSAIYFTLYEGVSPPSLPLLILPQLKNRLSSWLGSDRHNPSPQMSLLWSGPPHSSLLTPLSSAAFAGGVSAFVTSPLDMAKLRLQVPLVLSRPRSLQAVTVISGSATTACWEEYLSLILEDLSRHLPPRGRSEGTLQRCCCEGLSPPFSSSCLSD